jgi:hypothetical protein
MYAAMFGYKAPRPQTAPTDLVGSLLALGILGHVSCDIALANVGSFRWTTVPGTQHPGAHPLHRLAEPLFNPGYEIRVELVTRTAGARARTINPTAIRVLDTITPGTHVAVYDDSWVTGSSAQQVAVALKTAGAQSVSILNVARILDLEFSPSDAFVKSADFARDFDYTTCPWTGGPCP